MGSTVSSQVVVYITPTLKALLVRDTADETETNMLPTLTKHLSLRERSGVWLLPFVVSCGVFLTGCSDNSVPPGATLRAQSVKAEKSKGPALVAGKSRLPTESLRVRIASARFNRQEKRLVLALAFEVLTDVPVHIAAAGTFFAAEDGDALRDVRIEGDVIVLDFSRQLTAPPRDVVSEGPRSAAATQTFPVLNGLHRDLGGKLIEKYVLCFPVKYQASRNDEARMFELPHGARKIQCVIGYAFESAAEWQGSRHKELSKGHPYETDLRLNQDWQHLVHSDVIAVDFDKE